MSSQGSQRAHKQLTKDAQASPHTHTCTFVSSERMHRSRTHMRMHMHTHIQTHTHTHAHMHTYAHVHICTCAHMHTCAHTHGQGGGDLREDEESPPLPASGRKFPPPCSSMCVCVCNLFILPQVPPSLITHAHTHAVHPPSSLCVCVCNLFLLQVPPS